MGKYSDRQKVSMASNKSFVKFKHLLDMLELYYCKSYTYYWEENICSLSWNIKGHGAMGNLATYDIWASFLKWLILVFLVVPSTHSDMLMSGETNQWQCATGCLDSAEMPH